MARMFEGFTRQAADGIRRFFTQAPEQQAQELKQGAIPPMDKAGLPYSLVSQFSNDTMGEHLRIDTDLQARYTDYEEASLYPEMSCALDIYADDSTTPTMETGQSIWVESPEREVATDLNNMLHKRVNLEDDIWGHCRELGLYGNEYGELLVNETGIIGVNYLSPPTVRRIEDPRGTLLGFVQDIRGEFNISLEDFYTLAASRNRADARGRAPGEQTVFEDWEIVHWRLRTQQLRSIYGHSLLEASRYVWKRLSLLEDALLIYKLERAPSRYAFYVDVGELDAERGLAYVNRVKNQFTRKSFVNPTTGKLDFRYNPLCLRGDTKVQLLDGSTKTIRDMAAAHDKGEEQWVWSTDLEREGRLCPGKVVWAGKTRQNAQLVRVTLDNGKHVDVTPDHKMIRRDGSKVQAQELCPGDSLMPFRRRVSSKAKGEAMEGYELVYCPQQRKSLYGHRVVAKELGITASGQVTHHKDQNRLNNAPANLEAFSISEHLDLHRSLGMNPGRILAELRKKDGKLDKRLRHASRSNMIRYNQSPARRKRLSEQNILRNQVACMAGYNGSESHVAHNEIRRESKKEFWADESNRARFREKVAVKFPLAFVEGVRNLVRDNPSASMDELSQLANGRLLGVLKEVNSRRVKGVHRHMLTKLARHEGFGNFKEFRESAISDNHKVVSVEWLEEREDTYTLTVDDAHTFALDAGVFVCNSHDEDFWIPVRGGKRTTEVDIVQGPDYSETDTVEYHRDKLVASLKIPKSYMGYGGEATRGSLSTEDIRFARTVMRVQRAERMGWNKVCRVHIVARGGDPNAFEYDTKMNIPSVILDLARVEVLSAKSNVALQMGEQISTKWILTNIYRFSEDEAVKVMEEKKQELLGRGQIDAAVQKMMEGNVLPKGHPLTDGQELDRRLKQLEVNAKHTDWRKSFDHGSRNDEKRWSQKLDRLMRENRALSGRVHGLSGLMADIRQSFRNVPTEP